LRVAFVQDHRDVGPELRLNVDGTLGRQHVGGAVEMRSKRHALFRHLAHRREAEDLVPSAVGQDGMRPTDECMESAGTRNERRAGTKVQMICVAENDLGAEIFQIAVRDCLDRAARPHRHEGGRLHDAVRRGERAAAG
jgi:hypothetical protein